MIFGDSMRHTASMARWVSVAVTATDHTIWRSTTQLRYRPGLLLAELFADAAMVLDRRPRCEVFELEERPKLDFPVFERHPLGPLDGLFLGLHLNDPEAGDELLGLGERPIDDGTLAARYLMRAPFELGLRPDPSSITPAFTSSSLYFAISASIFSLGITPASES